MAKKYVVENAALNCQYGEESWLIVPGDRHIEISGRLMANETDYKKACLGCGGFGACHSPHVAQGVTQSFHDVLLGFDGLTNLHQLPDIGFSFPCQYQPGPQWMETKEDVYVAGYRALMEDSWTFCLYGLGIITLFNSGQGENTSETLQDGLKQLEKVVDTYMQENGIPQKHKNDLINSIVLWNGYESIPWDTKVSQELWDFGIYMEKNYPSLSNFFERGIYLFDEQTGTSIDISYMAGLNVAMNQSSNNCWSILHPAILEDEAAYNGYLEASRQESSENALEAMKKFMDFYESPDYSGNSRYSDYLEMPEDSRAVYEQMYEQGYSLDGSYYEPGVPLDYYGNPDEIMAKMDQLSNWDKWSQEEKDLLILQRTLSPYVGDEGADAFIKKVCESAGKERTSWRQSNRGN